MDFRKTKNSLQPSILYILFNLDTNYVFFLFIKMCKN